MLLVSYGLKKMIYIFPELNLITEFCGATTT